MSEQPTRGGRGRTSFLVMVAIGFVPLFIAYLLFFYFPGLIPTATTNQGRLIQPPLSIMDLGEETRAMIPAGKWTFIIIGGTPCDDTCKKAIYLARQVDVGVGKDSDRVQRVLVVQTTGFAGGPGERLTRDYPDMIVHYDPRGEAADRLNPVVGADSLDGKIFLADPNGNIILYFDQAEGGNPILKDLKHLLRLSNIG
ncbi:MAG: hypothetical protein WD002_09885 [Pseudomonadales bacterium]